MKKIFFSLFITVISLLANNEQWPFICSPSQIDMYINNRYVQVGGNDEYPAVVVDSKTIHIDRKNKIIKVWMVRIASDTGRANMAQKMSRFGNYNDFGLLNTLYLIDYSNKRNMIISSSMYDCNGKVIYSNDDADRTWQDIMPNSTFESIIDRIINKYNLK